MEENSGLNDNLNGVERPVSFDIPDVGHNAQVVQSLAKWKRLALKRYEFNVGKGLFTDMNAIRRDEEVDNLHSIYVDQWDWEKVIDAGDRNVSYLKRTVRDIVGAIVETNDALGIAFPSLHTKLSRDVFFITTQELEDKYPDLTPKQREDAICREHGTAAAFAAGGGVQQLEAQLLFGAAQHRPRLGIRHVHAQRGCPQGMQLLHTVQQLGDPGAENLIILHIKTEGHFQIHSIHRFILPAF